MIQSFLNFDSLDGTLKGDHSLESCRAVFSVVLFVFLFNPVSNFREFWTWHCQEWEMVILINANWFQ